MRAGIKTRIGNTIRRSELGCQLLTATKSYSRKDFFAKCLHQKGWNRLPILGVFADKLAVRDYVSATIGSERLVPLLASGATPADIDWQNLGREWVAKATHGCRAIVVVTERADPSVRLPEKVTGGWGSFIIHPDSLNIEVLKMHFESWLSKRYKWKPDFYDEWAYSKAKPAILVEPLVGGRDVLAKNLKVYCYSGVATSYFVTWLNHKFVEDADVRYLIEDIDAAAQTAGITTDELLEISMLSEALSAPTDRCRVDWLLTSEGVKFSEITNYPAGGVGTLTASPQRTAVEVEQYFNEVWVQPLIFTKGSVRRANRKARAKGLGLFS